MRERRLGLGAWVDSGRGRPRSPLLGIWSLKLGVYFPAFGVLRVALARSRHAGMQPFSSVELGKDCALTQLSCSIAQSTIPQSHPRQKTQPSMPRTRHPLCSAPHASSLANHKAESSLSTPYGFPQYHNL